jgi:hypothetical protein
MRKRTFYITVSIICTIGFLLILFAIFAEANSGKIVVYNEDGSVEKVEQFTYTPAKETYQKPAPVKGFHIVPQEEVEEDVPEIPITPAIKEEDKESNSNRRGKERDSQGRRRKIKKIENHQIDDKNVQVITRKETDKKGQIYETKEYIIDNRSSGSVRQRKKASDEAPNPERFKIERQVGNKTIRIGQ